MEDSRPAHRWFSQQESARLYYRHTVPQKGLICSLEVSRPSVNMRRPFRIPAHAAALSGQSFMPNRGTLGRIRTCDRRIRSPLLYPLSYEGVSAARIVRTL
jgi:hypothetical protein